MLGTVLALAVAAAPAAGQSHIAPGGWTAVRAGKWALLAVSVGFAAYALDHSHEAQRSYDRLRTYCQDQPASCEIGPAGRYTDPAAEDLYQGAITGDRQARVGIIAGQVALLGSATLFIIDLRGAGRPPDIPFPSSGVRAGPAFGVGVRVPLRLTR
jgi:hypothetical protein